MTDASPGAVERIFAIRGTTLYISDGAASRAADWIADELVLDHYGLERIDFVPGDIMVDIGAHVGIVAIYLAKRFPFLSIIAVEPDPANYRNLIGNIAWNGVDNVVPRRQAVTADGRPFALWTPPDNTGAASGFVRTVAGLGASVAPSTTLDALFAAHGIARCKLLKIDCEGAEHEILASTAVLPRVDYLSAEFHSNGLLDQRGQTIDGLVALVQAAIPPERLAIHTNRLTE